MANAQKTGQRAHKKRGDRKESVKKGAYQRLCSNLPGRLRTGGVVRLLSDQIVFLQFVEQEILGNRLGNIPVAFTLEVGFHQMLGIIQ